MKWVNTVLVITDKEKFQAFLLQGKAFNLVTKNIVPSLRHCSGFTSTCSA